MRPDQEARALEDQLGAYRYFELQLNVRDECLRALQQELNRRYAALLQAVMNDMVSADRRDQLLLLCPVR